MENYVEINAIVELIKEIRSLLETKHYLGALYLALTLPDSLGRAAYPKLKGVRDRYIRWFDENVRNIFGLLYSDPLYEKRIHFDGAKCYQLRCKLFHESTNDIAEKTKVGEFVLGFNDQRFFTGQLSGREYRWNEYNPQTGNVPFVEYLYVGCKELCVDILEAAERFLGSNPKLNYPKLKINGGGGKSPKHVFVFSSGPKKADE